MRSLLTSVTIACLFVVTCRADDSTSVILSGDHRENARLFSGRVVRLRDALTERKIASSAEIDSLVALQTDTGRLVPIIPDWRGRALYQDAELRDRRVELVAFRHPGVPMLQVLIVYTFDQHGVRQYTDYWCDICSIPMYEIKPCDCCQGLIRLRFQPRELPDYVRQQTEDRQPQPPETQADVKGTDD